jgi:ATP adenylyltransferase
VSPSCHGVSARFRPRPVVYFLCLPLLKQILALGMLKMLLRKGTLWGRIIATTEQAVASGVLLSAPTTFTFVEDSGIRFFVRVLSSLQRKDEAREKQSALSDKQLNPFLPPEKDLTVADISDTHIAILNKYNVVDHHLLIVTKGFEDQETLLTARDFDALWTCMTEFNCLGFYNGGREAGASQLHKHLQIVPLPLAPEGPAVPIEPLLEQAVGDPVGTIPGFFFLHAFVRLDPNLAESPSEAAKKTFMLYSAMLRSVGMSAPAPTGLTIQSMPYCLLVTRGWMLLVPRSTEFFEDISLNSLAFAGSFFVRNVQQLERLRSVGPMHALTSVTVDNRRNLPLNRTS